LWRKEKKEMGTRNRSVVGSPSFLIGWLGENLLTNSIYTEDYVTLQEDEGAKHTISI
jgi:hypothetical protein